MSKYTELLNLNSQAVKNLYSAYNGYANYLSAFENQKYNSYIASSFLIAGTFQLLINPQTAIEILAKSAIYYKKENNSFWKIIAICSNDINLINENTNSKFLVSVLPEMHFHEMLSNQFKQSLDGKIDFSFNESPFISMPVGRLKIPMKIYLDAFTELSILDNPRNYIESSFRAALSILLNRGSETIQMLRADNYHWRKLNGTFIPVEPEILATCICLCQLLRIKRVNIIELVDDLRFVNAVAKIPLLIASDLTSNSNGRNIFVNK